MTGKIKDIDKTENPQSNPISTGRAFFIACAAIIFLIFVMNWITISDNVRSQAWVIYKTVEEANNNDGLLMADGDITSEIISRIHSRRDDYDLDRIVIDRIGNRNYFNGMEIEDGYPDDPKAKLKLKSTLHNGSDINVVVKNGEPIIHFKDFPPSFCGDSKIAVCEGNSLL